MFSVIKRKSTKKDVTGGYKMPFLILLYFHKFDIEFFNNFLGLI